MTANADTLSALIGRGMPSAPAIRALGRRSLSFALLSEVVARASRVLRSIGIGRSDRVAIVIPNGPEMAAVFLAVASAAVAAPLNPAYKADEFRYYLSDLGARALIVQSGVECAARAVAADLGIPVVELTPDDPAGAFWLVAPADLAAVPVAADCAGADDVALVLHTSGTTARPKIVPLRHVNLVASADNIAATLALTSDDVCLNIMPLFHIHGLAAALLASLAAGGSVVCSPGLNAFRFFSWLAEARPTWFTAVPTMHQTVLELASRFKEAMAHGRLRLIRSSSASLAPQVMTAVEQTFGVPVIEAYGMTEASHQMASNPLPPRRRRAGSVGVATGTEIAIMNEADRLLPAGSIGEIVIRGRNVMSGYENNSSANAKSFVDGWFRTGDAGAIDAEGYLRLTGRLKEIINRAGEKVSPVEVDSMLMNHPAVAQVATFAMSSKLFGEDVAAAVVLRYGAAVDAESLRRFAAERMAAFKVPREIVFVSELPKGSTGKIQRVGLAERLGIGD